METRRAKIIVFDQHIDNRGELFTMGVNHQIPFEIKRVFYIYGNGKARAGHAHKKCEQVMIVLHGRVRIYVEGVEHRMLNPKYGVYVPVGNEIVLKFDPGSILLVLASEEYDPDDYI